MNNKRNWHFGLMGLMISVIMAGCFSVDSIRSTPAAVTTPPTPPPAPVEIVQHPKIELAVDAQSFVELVCVD